MDKGTVQQACRRTAALVLAMVFLVLAGCAAEKMQVDQALLADTGAAARNQGVLDSYQVACPDVLEVRVAGRPDLSGSRPVGPDGCIDVEDGLRVRIEGLTQSEIVPVVAREVEIAHDRVSVQVIENRSQQVYLFGEVAGMQRSVPYIGPETVLDLLHRTGGVTPGAEVGRVYLIRPHIADGGNPEVFHVDLEAILHRGDQSTNVRVQPFDQVYVGQSKKRSYQKCVPPCLMPLYETACGMRRP
jgi:polysaccharide biosynthesis/export protein